jgi:hypothetical protein
LLKPCILGDAWFMFGNEFIPWTGKNVPPPPPKPPPDMFGENWCWAPWTGEFLVVVVVDDVGVFPRMSLSSLDPVSEIRFDESDDGTPRGPLPVPPPPPPPNSRSA